MKKAVLLVIMAIMGFCANAEEFVGVFGTYWGMEEDEVTQIMINRGWTVEANDARTTFKSVKYTKKSGSYGKIPVESITSLFLNGRLMTERINFEMAKLNDLADQKEALFDIVGMYDWEDIGEADIREDNTWFKWRQDVKSSDSVARMECIMSKDNGWGYCFLTYYYFIAFNLLELVEEQSIKDDM